LHGTGRCRVCSFPNKARFLAKSGGTDISIDLV
jgi:hypothetical protein